MRIPGFRVAAIAPLALLGAALVAHRRADCRHLPDVTAPRATANDNRVTAGSLVDGVLSVRLVVQNAGWYPDGPQGCGVTVNAFAEEGQTASIPGPLLRVRVGTELHITIRNSLAEPVSIRGLEDRTVAALGPVEIPAGESREFRFAATVAGTYYYFGGPPRARLPNAVAGGQLVGALIVDSASDAVEDRIFVMTRWALPRDGRRPFELNAFNGLSWPGTERLDLMQGRTVRWRIINATNLAHTMHLHGFQFTVVSAGNGVREPRPAELRVGEAPGLAFPRVEATEVVNPGGTFTMDWTPERVGNWILHCHLTMHMSGDQRLDRIPPLTDGADPESSRGHDPDAGGMAGLILGLTVRPVPGLDQPEPAEPRRSLRLYADVRRETFGAEPGYGFVVQEGDRPPAPDSIRIPGTPIVLDRGEPVRISIFNRLPDPLTVHWHAMELEKSYFDGVADWSGEPGRTAPTIAPGDSFAVEFTPPRSGTFIYHVHQGQQERLASGLYGPLLVVEPGQPPDPESDFTFVISEAGPQVLRAMNGDSVDALRNVRTAFLNGTTTPAPIDMIAGRTYRLRIISIPASGMFLIGIRGGSRQTWRLIAKDAADVSGSDPQPAQVAVLPGETFDYAFTPTSAGDLSFDVVGILQQGPALVGTPTSLPIRVR